MTEQRQEKANGLGKLSIAGKKRRKGQDLQPIQTAPPQQNGYRNNFAGTSALGPNPAISYQSNSLNLDSPSSPLNHHKATSIHPQYPAGRPGAYTFTPPANREAQLAVLSNTGSAQRSYQLNNQPSSQPDWQRVNVDETASEASEEEDLEDYCKGGYHPVEPGQVYKNGRYAVVRKLGWGHFSTVWLARDNMKNRHVALKVVRSATQYKETALDEIKLLEKIASANPSHPGRQHIVSLLDHFEHHGPNGMHICLVFEALGESVLSTIKRYQYRGLPIHIVKQVTKQVLLGLDYLHRECGVIHTDLKPENVLISIDNAEEVIAESRVSEPQETVTSPQWKTPQPPRYPSNMEHRIRPRRFVTRSQPLPSPASVVPKSFSNELGREHGRDTSMSPIRNGRQDENDEQNRPRMHRTSTAENLERDLSDMSLDYQLRKSQLTISQKRFSQDLHTIKVKIIDVGNACWVSEHFTNDLQTRQYRSPEVIIGAPWGASADVWSMSCMVFELLTGEYLFDPKESRTYRKDEDHVAQMIELLGDFPAHFIRSGMYANEIFNSRGKSRQLRNIHRLTYWGLAAVLKEKYDRNDFTLEADFMLKMLEIVPSRRADAGGMVGHEWLRDTIGMENVSVGRPMGGRGQGIAGWSEVVKTNRHRR